MFFRKTKRKIEQLTQEISDLKSLIKSREYERLKEESKSYKETLELLSKIKIGLDKVEVLNGDNFDGYVVKIKYKLPSATIYFDDNNNPIKNEMFYAINYLELMNYEDMKKVIGTFEKIKKGGEK